MKKHFNLTTTEDNGKAITTTNTSTEYPEELVRMLALAGQGMPQVAPAPVADDCGCGGSPCGCDEAVEEEMETEYQATPANDELSLDDYSKKTANSIPRQKKRLKPSAGDNPLEYSMNEDDIYEALMADFDLNEDDSFRDRDNFVTAYIGAAEELADDEEFEDGHVNWSSEGIANMERDAEMFFSKAEKLMQKTGGDPRQHGTDFWLTRNGHGAGFWDRDYGDLGDKLTAFAEKFGEVHIYKGDDGKAYVD
jgi:hypothetical protein